jgi:hypothetical protein
MRDRIAEGSNLEPIRQRTQRRRVAGFPRLAKPNNANTKFQSEQSVVRGEGEKRLLQLSYVNDQTAR